MGGLLAVVGLLCVVPGRGWAGEFRFVDQWQAGDLPAYGRVSVGLASVKPAALRRGLREEGATVRYAVLPLRESAEAEVPTVLAIVEREGAEPVIYVDLNADGRLARNEVARRADSKELPTGFAKADEPAWIAEVTRPRARTVAIRLSGLSAMVTCAVRGYVRARLPVGREKREAVLVDDNADLLLEEGRDSLYVDVDGNGSFDRRTERFPLQARVGVGEAAFRLALNVPLDEASWQVAPTGTVPVQLSLGAVAGRVESLSGSLSESNGHTHQVRSLDQPLDLPAGLYHPNGVLLKVQTEDGHLWTYTFGAVGGEPIEIAPAADPSTPVTVNLLDGLRFEITVTGAVQPEREVTFDSAVLTSTGLRLAGGERDGGRALPDALRILAPGGEVLQEKAYSFG